MIEVDSGVVGCVSSAFGSQHRGESDPVHGWNGHAEGGLSPPAVGVRGYITSG